MTVALRVVVTSEELQGLKKVYEPRGSYETKEEIRHHLEQAADELAVSIDREVCESSEVRALLEINSEHNSYWDISHIWYEELVGSLSTKFPELAEKICIWAKNERFDALVRIKW